MKNRILLTFSILFMITSCGDNNSDPVKEYYEWHQTWFFKTKKEILDNAMAGDNDQYIIKKYSLNGVVSYSKNDTIFITRRFLDGQKVQETHFYYNPHLELRREYCKSGRLCFEGVFYKKLSYGYSTWNHSNGNIRKKGIRYKGHKIGLWEEWDSAGKLINESMFENDEFLSKKFSGHDSMPLCYPSSRKSF